jgi:hypothetical protein
MRKLFLIVLAAVLLCRTAEANSYSTNFALTENPISENGRWINGKTTGVEWHDVQCTPGHAFGVGPQSPAPPYDDPTAVLTGTWGRTQTVEATVIVPASPSGSQEVELRVLTTITPGRIVGYEVLFSVTSNTYVDIERWDGGTNRSDFVSLVPGGYILAPRRLATGNRIKATVTPAGLISAYIDYGSGYQLIVQGTDTTYTSGAPGIGFFQYASAGSMSDFGLSSFSASDGTGLVAPAAPTGLRILVSEAQMDGAPPIVGSSSTNQFPNSTLFFRREFVLDRGRRRRVALPATTA